MSDREQIKALGKKLDFTKERSGVAGTISKMYVDNDRLEELTGVRIPIGEVVQEFPPDPFMELVSDQFQESDLVVLNHEVRFEDESAVVHEVEVPFEQVMPVLGEED